jgi:betaine-aldehyde dehydrogenase
MNLAVCSDIDRVLPAHRDHYYGGRWQPAAGGYRETWNPANNQSLGMCAEANEADVAAAVAAARDGYLEWRDIMPLERARMLRSIAAAFRAHAGELALLDSANCGGPVSLLAHDIEYAASHLDFFAGLVTEIKGDTIPMGQGAVNFSVREPWGVCARIVAYNHPFMFVGARLGSALAAGNTVIMKPAAQAPLSAYRMMEIIEHLVPPGVINVLSGGRACGEALVAHPDVPVISLIGSVDTGRAIAKGAAERLKHVLLELGGKNALIVFPDADIEKAVDGIVKGMNYGFCGQSCASTSRVFLHSSVHDEVLHLVLQRVRQFRPGSPLDPSTNMGSIISKDQHAKIMAYIDSAIREGARLETGGKRPDDPALEAGNFIEATVFSGVSMEMTIAREEIFGPVLSILKWDDETELLNEVNALDVGLTAAIYTNNLSVAHHFASRIEAGYIWVNHSAQHFLGTPFGGYKMSGIGREESIEELMSFTRQKNVYISY